jgi:hypothetical protein
MYKTIGTSYSFYMIVALVGMEFHSNQGNRQLSEKNNK